MGNADCTQFNKRSDKSVAPCHCVDSARCRIAFDNAVDTCTHALSQLHRQSASQWLHLRRLHLCIVRIRRAGRIAARIAASAVLIFLALLAPLGRADCHTHSSAERARAYGFGVFLIDKVDFVIQAAEPGVAAPAPTWRSGAQAWNMRMGVGKRTAASGCSIGVLVRCLMRTYHR